ncbi:MAG: hypothetical protein ACRC0A_07535 [Chitinophagaceae bacterium]
MIIARIAAYLDFKGIATYKAEENSGISNGTLSKAIREKTSIRTDILENYLKYHGDISPEWLLTGKDSMLRDVQPTTPTPRRHCSPKKQYPLPTPDLLAENTQLKATIADFKQDKTHLQETITHQQEQISFFYNIIKNWRILYLIIRKS